MLNASYADIYDLCRKSEYWIIDNNLLVSIEIIDFVNYFKRMVLNAST